MGKVRADVALVERGLAPSRHQAQALLLAGRVYSGERRVDKAGTLVASDAPLTVRAGAEFVSRGGHKLNGALETFALDVAGLVAADIGASTGGFTDCLLARGVSKVFAIDVGKGQLADKLRKDPRVVVREETNARYLSAADLEGRVDLVVVDASFISVTKLLGAILEILKPDGRLVALVKPQFEVGRDVASRGRGVVRDEATRLAALAEVRAGFESAGFRVLGECDSSLRGPRGNLEHFMLAAPR
jgi:23S rRNA (cytidine1920-2'-O)/16S rRNA (cytidine1409-2'-O)-methyltransferase